jgi:hypothetical protein
MIPVRPSVRLAQLLLLLLTGSLRAEPVEHHTVTTTPAGRLTVVTPAGHGTLPLHVSADWSRRIPEATRALVLVHGASRDLDASLRIALTALYAAGEAGRGTVLVLPQFLTESDAEARAVPTDMLRWTANGWIDGDVAARPAPLSSYDTIDAIMARLADAEIFPNLRHVVIAGHAAGAQLVQRYAVAGRGPAMLTQANVAVRYVVANPSSYLWFGEDRPAPVNHATCQAVDRWSYGLATAPAYVEKSDDLEERYIARDVVYLLGESDTDTDQSMLDRSCAAEAQGPTRYARGMNYLFALEQRHPNLVRHRILSIWGVGHDAGSMFLSACGLAALFDRPGCGAF